MATHQHLSRWVPTSRDTGTQTSRPPSLKPNDSIQVPKSDVDFQRQLESFRQEDFRPLLNLQRNQDINEHGTHDASAKEPKSPSARHRLSPALSPSQSRKRKPPYRFRVPVTDEDVIAATHDPYITVPFPQANDDVHVVRRYLYRVLTDSRWGISQQCPGAVRTTIADWTGDGNAFRQLIRRGELGTICSEINGDIATGEGVPARFRSLVIECIEAAVKAHLGDVKSTTEADIRPGRDRVVEQNAPEVRSERNTTSPRGGARLKTYTSLDDRETGRAERLPQRRAGSPPRVVTRHGPNGLIEIPYTDIYPAETNYESSATTSSNRSNESKGSWGRRIGQTVKKYLCSPKDLEQHAYPAHNPPPAWLKQQRRLENLRRRPKSRLMFPWKARKGTVKQSGRMLLDSDDEFEHELDTLLARHLNRLEMSETSPTDFENENHHEHEDRLTEQPTTFAPRDHRRNAMYAQRSSSIYSRSIDGTPDPTHVHPDGQDSSPTDDPFSDGHFIQRPNRALERQIAVSSLNPFLDQYSSTEEVPRIRGGSGGEEEEREGEKEGAEEENEAAEAVSSNASVTLIPGSPARHSSGEDASDNQTLIDDGTSSTRPPLLEPEPAMTQTISEKLSGGGTAGTVPVGSSEPAPFSSLSPPSTQPGPAIGPTATTTAVGEGATETAPVENSRPAPTSSTPSTPVKSDPTRRPAAATTAVDEDTIEPAPVETAEPAVRTPTTKAPEPERRHRVPGVHGTTIDYADPPADADDPTGAGSPPRTFCQRIREGLHGAFKWIWERLKYNFCSFDPGPAPAGTVVPLDDAPLAHPVPVTIV